MLPKKSLGQISPKKRKIEKEDSKAEESGSVELQAQPNAGEPGHSGQIKKTVPVPRHGHAAQPRERDIKQALWECILRRHSRILHVDNTLTRYGFYEEGTSPDEENLFILKNHVMANSVLADNMLGKTSKYCWFKALTPYENNWKDLSKQGKADLFRIMNTPSCLWPELMYDSDQKMWIKKVQMNEDDITDYVCLPDYGQTDGKYTCFIDHLSEGLTPEELGLRENFELVDDWMSALRTGSNWEGHTAVYHLFKELIKLLPQMNINTPVKVYHNEHDDKTSVCKYGCHASESSGSTCSAYGLPHLAVLSLDVKSGFAKYLAIVGIHVEGESDTQAQQKFFKEVVSILQAQDAVFGFLFSVSAVTGYYARRVEDSNGKICVDQLTYLIADPDTDLMNVGVFERLIMDILASLVFGVNAISV